MSAKISMLMPVYNEEAFIEQSLRWVLEYIDEAVIVDGSPTGPSTDRTPEIIESYIQKYPKRIRYMTGKYALPDGSWDESTQRNSGLSQVTGDYLLLHCGDMIYDKKDIEMLCNAVRTFPERKVFYCLFIEFWLDEEHVRLYGGGEGTLNEWFKLPVIGDVPIISMELRPYFHHGPHLDLAEVTSEDYLFLPHAFRYHYGWISGFEAQVEKHIRNITMGAWGEPMEHVRQAGDMAIAAWAIRHVMGYKDDACSFPYIGDPPGVMNGTQFTYMLGYDDAMEMYLKKYGKELEDEIFMDHQYEEEIEVAVVHDSDSGA